MDIFKYVILNGKYFWLPDYIQNTYLSEELYFVIYVMKGPNSINKTKNQLLNKSKKSSIFIKCILKNKYLCRY